VLPPSLDRISKLQVFILEGLHVQCKLTEFMICFQALWNS